MASRIYFFAFAFLLSYTTLICGTFNISDFGAVGDGKTLNTNAIQHAIDKCRDSGGGTVLIPTGIFISGTIQLYSNINLHLESGAVLKGSSRASDYYLHEGSDSLKKIRLGLIFTENSANVFITGEGNIDGNGDLFMDQNHSKVFDTLSTRFTRQKKHFREVPLGLGDGPLLPLDRPFQMIIFSNCRNITVKDVLISNSPFWTLHIADCDGVIVTDIKLWNSLMIPNNDGIDVTSSSNVLISNCDIRCGDDAIAITGYAYHFDLPGYKNIKHDSENITVDNCYLESRSSAIRIGGWDQNEMRNYSFSNIVIANSNRGINLCVRDKAGMSDLSFSNIIIKTHLHTGDWWGNGEPIHISAILGKENVSLGKIRNIKFSHITAEGESGILIFGSKESIIENISFSDISFTLKESLKNNIAGGNFDLRPAIDPSLTMFSHDIPGFYAGYVNHIRIDNFEFKWENISEEYFTNAMEFSNFKDVHINSFSGDPAPNCKNPASISLRNGIGYRIINSFPINKNLRLLRKENVID
ncbi:MAG TPA: glycosyl hydrolase family 28 protein [Ignavibacteriaceae bacterium]|nr:glycosyl hydrolase family 28 protein [Ignavibacteriaceae bacterium]